MRRKQYEFEAKRAYIVGRAEELYAEKGIEGTSMDDIAKAAGYTRRTLYSYFESCDEIGLAVLVDQQKKRWKSQKLAVEQANTGLDKLKVWAMFLFDYMQANPQELRLELYWDFYGIDRDRISQSLFEEFESVNGELADGLREIFLAGKADGSIRANLDTDSCISQILVSLRAVIHRATSYGYGFADIEPHPYVSQFLDMLLHGLQPK